MSVLELGLKLAIGYFLGVNLLYLLLLALSYFSIRKEQRMRPLLESIRSRSSLLAPPISVIAPAYNEELSIVDSVKSFLLLNYPRHEVVVVNDGSKDATMARLKEAFLLEPTEIVYDDTLSKTKLRGVYRSPLHPNLP